MRGSDDFSLYDIKGIFTEEDFEKEKEKFKKIFFASFKKIKKRFLLLLSAEIAALAAAFYLIYFKDGLFKHSFGVYILCVVIFALFCFLVVEYKNFGKEEKRYYFRVNNLTERITNKNLFLTVSEGEAKGVIKTAYKKHGVNLKTLLIILIVIIVIFYAVVPAVNKYKAKFTAQKWQTIENRLEIMPSLKTAIKNSIVKNKEDKFTGYNFSDRSCENYISILGEPEIKMTAFRGKIEESKGPLYDEKMGSAVDVYYDGMAYGLTYITVLQYYCSKDFRGAKQWLVFVFINNECRVYKDFIGDKYGNLEAFNLNEYLEGSTENAS